MYVEALPQSSQCCGSCVPSGCLENGQLHQVANFLPHVSTDIGGRYLTSFKLPFLYE